MVLFAVEVEPAGSKSPADVGVRIFKGERQDFGAAAPLPTRASSLKQVRAGDLLKSSPKLVELFGWARTIFAEQLSPYLA